MGWTTHDRLHFEFDSNHPPGGSLHEKIVVIDDRVAFIGGFDLGRRRWDTSSHLPEDERRVTPSNNSYPPFHDVQAVVEGEIAAVLGELARGRWERATGEEVEAAGRADDPWPRGVPPAIRDLEVGIVRTRPEHGDQEPVAETETFLCRLIGSAERFIYAENQYLTSDAIADAVAERLAGDDPPEVVMVTARENHGWLEQTVMGGLREGFRRRLGDADRSGRGRIYYPVVGEGVTPNVHSKVMVVDDRWAYIGSANLSNRSMGLDAECGLAIDWDGREDVSNALHDLRIRLVSEHLGVDPEELSEREDEDGPIAAVESLRGGERTLEKLDTDDQELTSTLEPVARLADPDRPIKLADLVDMIHDLF
jgi:phosphatidylserine/phosphatidylglycerophosphate/cardiolipin synthase-like enzyme